MAQDGGERLKEGDYVQVDPTSTIDENNAPSDKSSSSKRKSSIPDEVSPKKSRGSTSDDFGIASTNSPSSTTKTPHVSANTFSPNDLMLKQSLQEILKTHKMVRMKKDGACFFRCAAHQLLGDPEMHQKCRNDAMDFMSQHPEQFEEGLKGLHPTSTVEAYVKEHLQSDQFADNCDIAATAGALKSRIIVYQYGKDAMVVDPIGYDNNATKTVIRVAYINGNHYDSLIPQEVQRQRPRRNAAEMGELKIRQIEDTPKSSKLQNSKKLKVKAKTQSLDSKRGAHLICPICEKDLSKLGEIVRAVHCNTCIDKEITRRNLNNANSESNDEDCSDGSVDEDCSDGSVDEDGSDNTEEDVTIENDEKFSGSTTSAKSFMNASINILALQSPTQSEITPSAHPDMDRMIQLIEVHGHCVYGLFLLKEDGSIDHCFYIGESRSPLDRLLGHRSDPNENIAKWEYFKNYPRHRIRMIILRRENKGQCLLLETLLISNAKDLPMFKLTNHRKKSACLKLDCNVVSGLQQLLDLAISKNEGFGADIVETPETLRYRTLDLNHSKTLQNLGLINMVLPSNPPMRDISPEKDLLKLDIHQSIIEIDIAKSNIAKLQSPYVDTFGFQKTQLTDHGTILDAKTLVGTFTLMTQEQFEKLVHDEHSAIAFAARCQLIRNTRKCKKCGTDMRVSEVKKCLFTRSTSDFVHCIGRTGRAGKEGKSITYFTETDLKYIRPIATVIHQAGFDVPSYTLALDKPSKKQKKEFQSNEIERKTFGSVKKWEKVKRFKKMNEEILEIIKVKGQMLADADNGGDIVGKPRSSHLKKKKKLLGKKSEAKTKVLKPEIQKKRNLGNPLKKKEPKKMKVKKS